MADIIIPFTSVGGYSTGLTAELIIEEGGGTRVNTTAGATFSGTVSMSGGLSASGGITFNGTVTGVTATFSRLTTHNAGLTTSFLFASSGSTFGSTLQVSGGATLASTLDVTGVARFAGGVTFSGQVNATTLKLNTVGGDEGGQIDFGLPATNTTLTTGVAIDIYQNKLRFFETGGNSRGSYIDLTAMSNGAASPVAVTNIAQTFSALQTFSNGISSGTTLSFSDGSEQYRAPQGNRTPGYLTTVNFINSSGVTSTNQNNYYFPEFVRTGSQNSIAVVANRIYFNVIYLSRKTIIRRLSIKSGNTVTTGNFTYGIYSNNPTSGLPLTKLYDSGSVAVGSGYNENAVNNDAGLITLQPGFYHLAAIYSSTPTVFGVNGGSTNYCQYGATDSAGATQVIPWIDHSSYALPTSTAGLTFYFYNGGVPSAGGTEPLKFAFGVTG